MGTIEGKVFPASTAKEMTLLFAKMLKETSSLFDGSVYNVDSKSREEHYAFLADPVRVNEFKDKRIAQQMIDHKYSIVNKKFETTDFVSQDDVDDDKLSTHVKRAETHGAKMKTYSDRLIADILIAGEVGLCFDGQNFFDTVHQLKGETAWSNLLTGTGTSDAQLKADLQAAEEAFWTIPDTNGDPFFEDDAEALKFEVWVPSEIYWAVYNIINTPPTPASYNQFHNRYTLKMISRLSDVNDWYMTIKGQAEMPFVLQMRKRPEFAMPNFLKGGKGSAYQFEEDGWLYGALMRLNVGYGWPQTIIKNKNP